MRKVYLVNGHVVYVYWIDTVYVQNNLNLVKGQFSYSKEKYAKTL